MNFSWGLAGVAGGVDLPLLGIFHQLHLLVFLRHGCSTVLFTLEWLALSPWEQILQLIQIYPNIVFQVHLCHPKKAASFRVPPTTSSCIHVCAFRKTCWNTIESAFVTSYFLIRIDELAVPARFVHQLGRMASWRAKHWQGWSKRLVWFQEQFEEKEHLDLNFFQNARFAYCPIETLQNQMRQNSKSLNLRSL